MKSLEWALIHITGILIKNGNLNIDTHTQGECLAKMKAEILVMLLQAKECQLLPANHQKLRACHGTDSSSQASEGINPANTLL